MDAPSCRCTSPVIYINGPLRGDVVREENLVMGGRLNTHDAQCEEELLCTVIMRGGGKRAGECHCFVGFFSPSPFICIHKHKKVLSRAEYARAAAWVPFLCSSPSPGSDIVQWMIKNLDIEDQGRTVIPGVVPGPSRLPSLHCATYYLIALPNAILLLKKKLPARCIIKGLFNFCYTYFFFCTCVCYLPSSLCFDFFIPLAKGQRTQLCIRLN